MMHLFVSIFISCFYAMSLYPSLQQNFQDKNIPSAPPRECHASSLVNYEESASVAYAYAVLIQENDDAQACHESNLTNDADVQSKVISSENNLDSQPSRTIFKREANRLLARNATNIQNETGARSLADVCCFKKPRDSWQDEHSKHPNVYACVGKSCGKCAVLCCTPIQTTQEARAMTLVNCTYTLVCPIVWCYQIKDTCCNCNK